MAENRYIFILLVSFLIVGFNLQSNLSPQPFLFAETESESKESEFQRFKAREQAEFIYLQDSITESILLRFFKEYRNISFSSTSNCFYSMILPHKLFNHSPPQFA